MEKTSFGISVWLVSALVFLVCLFGGYIPALLFVGYILLKESNVLLKKNALGALILLALFSVASYLIGFIPDAIYIVDGFVGLFGGSCQALELQNVANLLSNILSLIKTILFLIFAAKSIKGNAIDLPFCKKIIERNFEE